MKRCATLFAGSAAVLLAHAPAAAQESLVEVGAGAAQELSQLSIEELAQITVRSASKREEPLIAAPTALFVLRGEEIEQTAANSIPEALRMAPNLQVQQIDARQYAITARGFNSLETSNKLLVLVDGRTVYSPLASNVFWELHNRPIEEIAQIEVISGPGGTLYGPNAVNGVINILTHDAHDTVGGLLRGTIGEEERSLAARFGAALGSSGAIRVYGHWFDRDGLPAGLGPELDDRFSGLQAGFRTDFAGARDHFTIQGDIFDTEVGALPGDGDSGHNLLARWTRALGEESSLQIQAYYDHFERDYLLVHDALTTFDAEAQLNHSAGAHDIVVGGGVRTTRDEFINNLNAFQLDPPRRRLWVFNVFAQDRISVTEELSLILGLKVEQTSFTGIEFLPNARLAWQPDERTLLWAAVSRAVRTPSRIDRQLAALPILAPATDFDSETLTAFEAGYRSQPTERTTLSVSVFFNVYDQIRSTESFGDPLPFRLANSWQGNSYGIEAWGGGQLTSWWRFNLGLSTLWKDFELEAGRIDAAAGDSLGHDPDYQLFARSHMDLTDRLRLNVGLRWIGELDSRSGPGIGDYVEADARLAFAVSDNLELYLAGRNLLREAHAESDDPQRAQLARRSLFAGTRVRF